ncbi:hypothetical protein ACNKHX_26710 [Shigella flexneri]
MIEIESRELADIPVLHAYPVGQKDTPLPCVIFYYGFTSSAWCIAILPLRWRRLVCG